MSDPLTELEALHREVDGRAAELARRHAARLQCRRGCADCCVDDLNVFDIEAERIRRAHVELLEHGQAHRPGACVFLDASGACRVYASRPYVCRTQGLPLRWLEAGSESGGAIEYRDICPLNDAGGPPLAQLDAETCWTIGPVEGRLAELQRRFGGEPLRRTRLRDLFG